MHMNLYIKQKVFTWGDKFSIYDAGGNERYFVKGEVFTFGKKLHLYALNGEELAYIEQKVFSFLPKYYVFKGERQAAEVIKEFTFFKQEYTVRGPEWRVHGDFFDHSYEVTDGMRSIASVSREWFTLGDAYEIDLCEGVDEVLAVAVCLVIDACIDAQND